jgi:SSS family solute:Na+ symporter
MLLGLLGLVAFMAIAAGVATMPEFAPGFKAYSNNFAVPALFMAMFPDWFVGVAFAAIGIGALVPAAIMSIASANTYTRNIYREFINPNCTDLQESRMAKIVSLVIKAGALVFIFFVPLQYALWLQLLGGVWIIQTVPSVVIGLYTRYYHGWALFLGWAAGFGTGTWMAVTNNYAPVYPLKLLGTTFPCYIALATLVLNIVVATVLSPVFNAVASDKANDATRVADYV